jgi:hypothetical protein
MPRAIATLQIQQIASPSLIGFALPAADPILAVQGRIAEGVRERRGPEPIGGAGAGPCSVRTTPEHA